MMTTHQMDVSVSNIGGIDDAEQAFEPGITVLAGRNATNRTSFLQAVMAAFGSDRASLKADADEGFVELTIDGDEYTRTFARTNDGVTMGGDPYLDDPEVADLFAFLTEVNEARFAVSRDDDLRDIIMRPVDTAAIKSEIQDLEAEKREIDSEIEEIESKKNRIPELESKLDERKDSIEEKETELSEKEAELDALDRDIEETKREKSELEETFSELRDARQELENLNYRLETEEESLQSLESEQSELEEAREDLDTVSETRREEIDTELQNLRSEKQDLESEVSTLQQVIQFNEEMLEGASTEIASALRADGGADSEAVTEQLVSDQQVVCWTCGSKVDQSSIEETLDRLRDLLSTKHGSIRDLEDDISEIQEQIQSIESKRQRAEEVTQRLSEIEAEIENREDTISGLREDIQGQKEEIQRLEAEAESQEDESYSQILEKHKETNQLEFELERLRNEMNDIETELETVTAEIEDFDSLEERRSRIANKLQDLRTKIEQLEQDAVDAFNEHMEEILEILEYENIERIWLERTTTEVKKGRKKETRSVFDLHVIRASADGTTFEDTIDHLSESEREVIGLIFALAGYLVHEVYEVLPVMLLDSLEAIDSDRIAALVEYFEQYADYLLVALLPEDARALSNPDAVLWKPFEADSGSSQA